MSIPSDSLFVVVRHLKNNEGSIYLNDLDTEENHRQNLKIPVYVPYGETVTIPLNDAVLISLDRGSLCKHEENGLIDVYIFSNLTVTEVSTSQTIRIGDEVVLVDTSGGDVTLTLPLLEDDTTGHETVIKKISQDTNAVILQPTSPNELDGSTSGVSFSEPLDSRSVHAANLNWWLTGHYPPTEADITVTLLSHFNTTDGTTDATVVGPTFPSRLVASPTSDLYGAGGWDDGTSHPVTQDTTISYENTEKATQLDEGEIVVNVVYFTTTNTEVTQSLTVALDGTSKDESNAGIRVEVTCLVDDISAKAGFVKTTITPLSLPDFSDGGRIKSFETKHVVGSDEYVFSDTDGVFVDNGPTPPTQGTISANIQNSSLRYLSGVPHYTNGTELRITQVFSEAFNRTYRDQPFRYDGSGLGFGAAWISETNSSISTPNSPPEYDDDADLDVTLTLSGNSVCETAGSVETRVRDPWGISGVVGETFSNTLIYNKSSSSTRHFEDFRDESRRLQRDDDNTAPDDRDVGNWDSTQTIDSFDDGFGAQLRSCSGGCDGFVTYPTTDYSSYAPSGPDYSSLGSDTYVGYGDVRWYYRFFSNSSGTVEHSGGVLRVNTCGTTLTLSDLDNDRIIVEVMLANTSADSSDGGRTGWLSLNKSFNSATFDPNGSTRDERAARTMVDEQGNSTTMPDIGYTLSSNTFNRFTSDTSNYGVRVRLGIREAHPFEVTALTMVGW